MAFGAGWGLANIGFGLGLKMVGLSVGTAIMLGLSNTLGALMPLVLYQRKHRPGKSSLRA